MRIVGILYVLVTLTLNFLWDHPFALLLAMSSFPVVVSLVVPKPQLRRKEKKPGKIGEGKREEALPVNGQ